MNDIRVIPGTSQVEYSWMDQKGKHSNTFNVKVIVSGGSRNLRPEEASNDALISGIKTAIVGKSNEIKEGQYDPVKNQLTINYRNGETQTYTISEETEGSEMGSIHLQASSSVRDIEEQAPEIKGLLFDFLLPDNLDPDLELSDLTGIQDLNDDRMMKIFGDDKQFSSEFLIPMIYNTLIHDVKDEMGWENLKEKYQSFGGVIDWLDKDKTANRIVKKFFENLKAEVDIRQNPADLKNKLERETSSFKGKAVITLIPNFDQKKMGILIKSIINNFDNIQTERNKLLGRK